MSLNLYLPFVSTLIMLVFVIWVMQRYFVRRRPEFLFWGIGLAMFGAGSFAEAYLALSWNKWIFFVWYLFGAALNAAWLGQGTLYLMVKKNWRHGATVVLVAFSLFATYLMVQAIGNLDESLYVTEIPVSEQYGTKITAYGEGDVAPADAELTPLTLDCGSGTADSALDVPQAWVDRMVRSECAEAGSAVLSYDVAMETGLMPYGTPVRLTTPFLNIYGLLTLVGGAIYSAFLFYRKQVLANRVVANVLIAAGALLIGFASTLTRLGYGEYLYIGELLSAILMFAGFRMASKPQAAEVPAAATPAAAD